MSLKKQKFGPDDMIPPYAQLGFEPVKGQNSTAWFIPEGAVIYDNKSPKSFFTTTGEATIKIDVMIQHLQQQLKEARKLKKLLVMTKAENKYLETCWESGILLVKTKNSRARRPRDTSQ